MFYVVLFEDFLRNWHYIVMVEDVYISINIVESVMLLWYYFGVFIGSGIAIGSRKVLKNTKEVHMRFVAVN